MGLGYATNSNLMSAIRDGLPIMRCGLTFYPITMRDYEEFLFCKDALTLRLGKLPAKYLMCDWVSAIFTYDIDAQMATGQAVGYASKFMRFLCLALKKTFHAEIAKDWVHYDYASDGRIKGIDHFEIPTADGTVINLTSQDISTQIREILCTQNGLEVPDESENIDIIEDEEEVKAFYAERNGTAKLKVDINELIASVAYQSLVREKDINEWTVREFEYRRRAIDRDKRHTAYTQAELSGMVKFPKGNPVPSWCLDLLDDSHATVSVSQMTKGISEANGNQTIK